MVSQKIKQINAPLRFTTVALVCLRNDLKRNLDGSLKKYYFGRQTDTNNRIRLLHYPKITDLLWGYSTMHSLLGYQQSQGQAHTKQNSNQSFHLRGVWDSSVTLSKHGQCQIQNSHFSRYLIGGGKFRIYHLRNRFSKLPHVFKHHQNFT